MRLLEPEYLRCTNKYCKVSKKKFPIINEKPVLVPFGLEDCILEDSYSDNATLGRIKGFEFLFEGDLRRIQGINYLDQHHFIR